MARLSELIDVLKEIDGTIKEPLSLEEQDAKNKAFILKQAQLFNVGDEVVRNEFGKQRYKFPNDKITARVLSVFDKPMLDENGSVVTGEIVATLPSGNTAALAVDLRYYDHKPPATQAA